MKKLYFILLAMGLFFGLSACSDDKTEDQPAPSPNPTIQLDETEVVIPALGATIWVNYEITNPIEGEVLACSESDWVSVDLQTENTAKFTAGKNETGAERTAELVFSYKNAASVTVSVSQPAWEAPITLTVNAVESTKVNFSVVTTNPELTWLPLITTKDYYSQFQSFDEVVADDMEYIAWAAQEQEMTLAEYLPTLLQTGTMEGLAFKSLMPETEYVLYVYGLEADGTRTTDIFTAELTTAEPYDGPITFDIQVTEEDFVMDITVTPSHEGVAYYWNLMDEASWNDLEGTTDLEKITNMVEYDIEEMLYWGDIYSRSEYFEWYSTINASNSQFECMADTKYIIYAVKWNENCELEGEVATYRHTSASVEPSDNQITLTVSNATPTTFDVTTTTTNDDPYVVLAEPSEWCGWETMSDEEIFSYAMDYYGTWFITDYICYGSLSGARFTGLYTDTQYSVVAFGYEAGVRTTDIQRATITTLAGGDPADCTFEFEVEEVGSNYAYVTVTPSDSSHYYYWMIYEASTTADEVKTKIQEVINDWYYGDLWEFSYELAQGKSSGEVSLLAPNTEYKVAAVIMDDATGDYLSEVHFSETFFTTEMVYADIDVTCGFDAYYDGDLLAAASDQYAIYAGYALVPLKLQIEGQYGEYYYTMFSYEEGLEDPEIYPDYKLYESLYNGVYYSMEMNFRAPWDEPVMIAAVAIDYYGNFSPVYRQVVTFTKEGASPIDELINATRSMMLRGEQIDTFSAPARQQAKIERIKKQTSNRFNGEVINQLKESNRMKTEAEKREQKRAELQSRKAKARIRIAE